MLALLSSYSSFNIKKVFIRMVQIEMVRMAGNEEVKEANSKLVFKFGPNSSSRSAWENDSISTSSNLSIRNSS